ALTVLIASMLGSWSLSQGLAYLGYLRIGQMDMPGARRVLRAGLLIGAAFVGAVVTLVTWLGHGTIGALAFGIGQGLYMFVACGLMGLGRERRGLYTLAPGVLAAPAFLPLGQPSRSRLELEAGLAATPALALILALAVTWRTKGARPGPLVARAELGRMVAA